MMEEHIPLSDVSDVSRAASTDPAVMDTTSVVVDFLVMGGPVLQLLAGLSVVTLALIIAKYLQFSSARLGGRSRSGALKRVRVATQRATDARANEERVEKVGFWAARRELRPLEVGLGMLGMIAMLSPLIGLLGTVIGMIDAFRALEGAGGSVDPSLLSAGIWVALLTTAGGLIVAIPATVAHGWFEGRLTRFADLAEQAISEIVDSSRDNDRHLGVAAD